jgi:hypothetical protein
VYFFNILYFVENEHLPQSQIAPPRQSFEMRKMQYPGLDLPSARIILLPLLENGKKHFLGNVLGLGSVTKNIECGSKDGAVIAPEQLGEAVTASGANVCEQHRVG